ncbi:Protein CBG04350 [Caenorhabditis briggsae]|uniref:Protein CBG04350 n=1 Tax=Caenorhabditis briggsae TaxID=6238 RepID=A8WXB9_CAEBR|nr:Protein CBG04350 [Caenorhabditis briggsae]CAP25078.2 Protein CBG04350 [Caenorhabditis briggsae]
MMPRTALSIYINHFVQPDNIIAIPNLIDSIRSEYIDQISKSKKFDKPLKAQMIKKLEKFKTDIGSHGIGFSENNLLERVIIHNRQSFYKVITQFNTQNMQEALLSIAHDKTIKIYALMKTQPRFDVSYPSAVQYGKGGHDVASDMSVILKTLGKNATKSFGKCLLGHSHDANILVDFMGMKVAWDKYRKSKKPEELQLPEFDYATGDQLFFYSMIQSTCQKKTTKNTVSHGNRLNFLLQQIEGFGEAFNCPAGANMMKKKLKCEPNDDLMMI